MPHAASPPSTSSAEPRGEAWPAAALEAARSALPDFLLRQRWYPAKGAGRPGIELVALVPLAGCGVPAAVATWRVTPPGQAALHLLVPLALVPAEAADPAQVIVALNDGTLGLVDAFSVDGFIRAWIGLMLRGGTVAWGDATLRMAHSPQVTASILGPPQSWAIRRGKAEQTNTSIRIGETAILKAFRKLEAGIHPELEVSRFLTAARPEGPGFTATPAMFGWGELDGVTLAILQAFVPNQGDGWSWMLGQLAGATPEAETIPWLRHLGRRTAEMHHAFSIDTADPAFQPEPVRDEDLRHWADAARAEARRHLDRLAASASPREEAAALLARRDELFAWVDAMLRDVPRFNRIRHHGDFHLGQVLVVGEDAVIVDFEGEPMRPLEERRGKHAALRDVAGLLRSLAYAEAAAGRALPAELPAAARQAALQRLSAWQEAASAAFLDAYLDSASGGAFRPAGRADADRLVRFFMMEKALYEVGYEEANRPDWVDIPLRGVLALLDPAAARGDTALDELAERMGIEPDFLDAHGRTVRTRADTKRRLLAAMGIEAADDAQAAAALQALDRKAWDCVLPPVAVLHEDAADRSIAVTLPAATGTLTWRLSLEDEGERSGQADFARLPLLAEHEVEGQALQRRRLDLPAGLPPGYHRLEVQPGGASMSLVVTPGRCWLPSALEGGRRLWGIAAQVYLLRSATDWGIGDFGDLRSLVDLAAVRGADVVGVNPLHAMFTDAPEQASPYSPASRLLLNLLNIDVNAVPELPDSPEARALLEDESFQRDLRDCRARPLVDYSRVTAMKLAVLERLFETCQAAADQTRWQQFVAFRREGGEVLERHCLFLALRERFAAEDSASADWHAWPEAFRDPASAAVAGFAADNRRRITFLAWMQWLADTQLGAAAAAAADRGMIVGLYRDLAVGGDRAGAETWANAAAVVSGAQVGAPPDLYNTAGQDWGLPPFHPQALRAEGYRSFIDLVRANMRHAGGLRIDHVMALQHLYWVPQGCKPTQGAYVRYPMEDLIGILALESHRQRCLVVGEDLGTVPEGFRERMAAANILSYRVLFFEKAEADDAADGGFLPPEAYPHLALAVLGSHDLPTLRGWWQGRDIDLRERLGLYPRPGEAAAQREARDLERAQLLRALRDAALLPRRGEPDSASLARAAHAFLARSPAMLAMAQIDDLTDEGDPVNLPATSDEHPNWRRRQSMMLEDLAARPEFEEIAARFRAERGRAEREAG